MARPQRFTVAGVAARRVGTTKIPQFVTAAIGPIDWDRWWGFEDYRAYTNLQVFATGAADYAGRPPTIQALIGGMDAVFTFVLANAPWPSPTPLEDATKPQAAADAAVEVARLMYEQDAIDAALPALIAKWQKRVGALASAQVGNAAVAARIQRAQLARRR